MAEYPKDQTTGRPHRQGICSVVISHWLLQIVGEKNPDDSRFDYVIGVQVNGSGLNIIFLHPGETVRVQNVNT